MQLCEVVQWSARKNQIQEYRRSVAQLDQLFARKETFVVEACTGNSIAQRVSYYSQDTEALERKLKETETAEQIKSVLLGQ